MHDIVERVDVQNAPMEELDAHDCRQNVAEHRTTSDQNVHTYA